MLRNVAVCSYSMDVQRVHGEVVGVHVEGAEDFLQSDLLAALFQDHTVGLRLVGGLYKLQQMLLVHAGGGVNVCVHLRLVELQVSSEQIRLSSFIRIRTSDGPF